ncbi:GRAM domain-containing protein 1B [Stylophora pistillata]|uniref:GRAM domain-containing protein 1B n=1 Tax=Stylophora pistillata TaxID=50429 RepID=A0A2B4STP7_STYPI|nr:GRAM domain-containing protein 1B [Stylophora pistillata]
MSQILKSDRTPNFIKVTIDCTKIQSITKEKTAYVVPNAILVCTDEEKHFFSSFLSRETVYKLLLQVWDEVKAKNEKMDGVELENQKTEAGFPTEDKDVWEDEDEEQNAEENNVKIRKIGRHLAPRPSLKRNGSSGLTREQLFYITTCFLQKSMYQLWKLRQEVFDAEVVRFKTIVAANLNAITQVCHLFNLEIKDLFEVVSITSSDMGDPMAGRD